MENYQEHAVPHGFQFSILHSQFSLQVRVLPTHRCVGCRSILRRDQRPVLPSVSAPGGSGNCECHDPRDARPLALECSSDSFPNRCLPIVAIEFPREIEAHRSDSSPPLLARADLPRLVLPFTIRSEENQMTLEQVLSEISSLTPSEQLKIAQVIWDRLPDEFGTDISPAQQAELDRRWIEYKKDPSSALTMEEFRERMRVARGK